MSLAIGSSHAARRHSATTSPRNEWIKALAVGGPRSCAPGSLDGHDDSKRWQPASLDPVFAEAPGVVREFVASERARSHSERSRCHMECNEPGFRSLLFVSRPLRMLMWPTALRNGLHTDRRLLGHDVLVAHDVSTALRHAEESGPHVALVDVGLPEMDGYQLAQQLRAMPGLQTTPLVALAGDALDGDCERSRQAGFSHRLPKPVDRVALAALLPVLG